MNRSSQVGTGSDPPALRHYSVFPKGSRAYLGTEVLGIIVKYVYNQSEHW